MLERDDTLAKRLTISDVVAVYERAVATVKDTYARTHESEQELGTILGGHIHIRDCHNRSMYWEDPKDVLQNLHRDVWRCIVDRLGVRAMISIKDAEKLDQQLERGDMPPITVENVEAMARGFAQQLPSMIETAVLEVYEYLRPHDDSWRFKEYKTNQKNARFEVGERVILTSIVESGWAVSGRFQVNHHAEKYLTALENVFTALDGKGQVHKGYRCELSNAIAKSETGEAQTKYFHVRCYRNHNMHLTFLIPELLARFNQIAGGQRLKGKSTPQKCRKQASP